MLEQPFPKAKASHSLDVLILRRCFCVMAGYSAHPPPSSLSNQGSEGAQQGPLSSWADLILQDWSWLAVGPWCFLPRRMINSMLCTALASAVILSLSRGRCCYTEGWTRLWLNGHRCTPRHTQQCICQLVSVHKCPSYGLDQGCRISIAKLLVLRHHQFAQPCCIKLLECLEWCGAPCLP